MTNVPWTPGPWDVVIDDTGGPFSGWPSVVAPEDVDASVVHRAGFKQEFWGDWSMRQACANARLIAEAPAMAEALEKCADELFAMFEEVRSERGLETIPTHWLGEANKARAILARIKGETP